MMTHSVVLFSPWFGPWPEWINLHMESIRYNPSITWIFPTDQAPPENVPPNCHFLSMSLQDFVDRAAEVSGLDLTATSAYKICDYRPMIGEMFEPTLTSFTHFGYTDLDVIYGDLSVELSSERLEIYDVISSHAALQSGHMSLFKNTKKLRRAFRTVPGWRKDIASPDHTGFDERRFGRWIPNKWWRLFPRYRVLWSEWYSTPEGHYNWIDDVPQHPSEWVWKDGVLRNTSDGDRQFAYLHFMNWRSGQYRRDGAAAPWQNLDHILHTDWQTACANGFTISPLGIHALSAKI